MNIKEFEKILKYKVGLKTGLVIMLITTVTLSLLVTVFLINSSENLAPRKSSASINNLEPSVPETLFVADFSKLWTSFAKSDISSNPARIIKIYSETDSTGIVGGSVGSKIASVELQAPYSTPGVPSFGSISIPYNLPVSSAYSIQFNTKWVSGSDYRVGVGMKLNNIGLNSYYIIEIKTVDQTWSISKSDVSGSLINLGSGTSTYINRDDGLNKFRIDSNPVAGTISFFINNQRVIDISNETTYTGGVSKLTINGEYLVNSKVQFGQFTVTTPLSVFCGGIAGIMCPTGYECIYEYGNKSAPYPDASGVCAVTTSKVTLTPTITLVPLSKTNLILNPGFEIDVNNDGKPDSWTNRSLFTKSKVSVHGGNYSGRHYSSVDSSYNLDQVVKNISPNTLYTFSGWSNIPPTSDTFTYKIQLIWKDINGVIVRTDAIKTYTVSTSGWNKVVVAKTSPVSASSVVVRMAMTSLKDSVFVDDFSLYK